jgi:phosphatidylglycerol---prolipoprotein diacylglyceryl transferase
MIDITPNPIAVQIGPIPIQWYGIGYALGLALTYFVMSREARRRGYDPEILGNGLIIVAIAALIGGRLYHVIDQWQNLYASCPITAVVPIRFAEDCSGSWTFAGFSGLGVYGGLITGTIAAALFLRIKRESFWTWADIVAPGLFAMQFVARWGNFFNQELYGPPTNLPWGIAIECQHRIEAYPCATFPFETTHFQPLFLYESLSGLLGMIGLLFLARRFARVLRTGDLLGVFFIWYGIVRFGLETLRSDNWTFFGIPTAQIFSVLFIVAGVGIIVLRRLRDAPSLADVDEAARLDREVAEEEAVAAAAGANEPPPATEGAEAPQASEPSPPPA